MIHPPSNSPSLLKRVIRRLGLDSKQAPYFFYVPNAKSEKGSLVALAAVFMLVVAVLIPVAMTLVRNVRTDTSQAQLYVAGAQNAAKAGLEDALGYFIRQGKLLTAYSGNVMTNTTPTPTVFAAGMSYVDQPFNPVYNTANAQYSDTFQGTTVNLAGGITHAFYGLCNEYPIDASANSLVAAGQTTSVYFARYEIAEQTSPALISPTATLNPLAVHDITGTKQPDYMNGDGLVWAITSTGYIYKR
ncbi:MAG TPA: hypothetical protein VK791_05850, partial [bacterium]|nr:hypothetical protein [bacterium]